MKRFALLPPRRDRGASAVEYALLIAGIGLLIVISAFAFGGVVRGMVTAAVRTSGGASVNPVDV